MTQFYTWIGLKHTTKVDVSLASKTPVLGKTVKREFVEGTGTSEMGLSSSDFSSALKLFTNGRKYLHVYDTFTLLKILQ